MNSLFHLKRDTTNDKSHESVVLFTVLVYMIFHLITEGPTTAHNCYISNWHNYELKYKIGIYNTKVSRPVPLYSHWASMVVSLSSLIVE